MSKNVVVLYAINIENIREKIQNPYRSPKYQITIVSSQFFMKIEL